MSQSSYNQFRKKLDQKVKQTKKQINKQSTASNRRFVSEDCEVFSEDHYSRKKQGKKLDNIKCKRNFKPHFGLEVADVILESFKDMAGFAQVELPDSYLRKVEGIIALFVNLQTCTTISHLSSTLVLYFRDFTDKSLSSTVLKYVKSIVDEAPFVQQSDKGDPNWLAMLKDVQDNWTLVKGNKAFRQFSKLLGVLVTLGLCDAADLKFDIGGFKLFDDEIFKKHMSAHDLADAIFGTITYFAEGMYRCFQRGSLQPLLVNDFSMLEMDDEYHRIILWWDLVKNGNLERVEGVTDSEFGHRLEKMIIKCSNMTCTFSGLDKTLMSNKVLKLKTIKNDFICKKISSGTRKSPFAFEIFGPSSQGKTTFGDQMTTALLTSANLPITNEYRAALNPADKFMSNWTSDKLVAILDDVANEKSDFVQQCPTRAIIDICNNQMYYAPKAELEAKGKCFVEPEIVMVTTNKKDLDAYVYSNCPYSIQRRMDLVFTVVCKPEFQRVIVEPSGTLIPCGVDSSKVREFYTIDGVYTPPNVDDIWSITIERAMQPVALTAVADYQPVVWRGKPMVGVSSHVAIQCAIEHYQAHRVNQECIISSMNARQTVMKKCSHPDCNQICGMCPDHMEPHFGLHAALAIHKITRDVRNMIAKDTATFSEKIERAVTKQLYDQANIFLAKWDWICFLPSPVLDNEHMIDFLCWYYKDNIVTGYKSKILSFVLLSLIVSMINLSLGIAFFISYGLLSFVFTKNTHKKDLIEALKKRNDSLPIIIRGVRDKYVKAICYSAIGISALVIMAKIYSHWKKLRVSQGSLKPTTVEEIKQRDSEGNAWSVARATPLPISEASKTTVHADLLRYVKSNIRYASVNDGEKTMMVNVFFITSNVMIIPGHYFNDSDTLKLVCTSDHPHVVGSSFETILCKSAAYRVPDTDLMVCYTPNGAAKKDLTKFFPLSRKLRNCPATMTYRLKDGEILSAKAMLEICLTSNSESVFQGGNYKNLTVNTFAGMCGAVWVTETVAPCIAGFHLGGHAGTPNGCFGSLAQKDILDGMAYLRKIPGVILSGSGEHFTPKVLGVQMTTNDPLHYKSPLNYLPHNAQFEYFGSCVGSTSSRSDVRRTPISASVTKYSGSENIWGAPKMQPEYFGWQTCLSNASNPGSPFPHDLLIHSVRDYQKPLIDLIRAVEWRDLKPLDDHTNLNGKPGCRFIDAINLNTSMGYPLTGAKRKFVIEQPPTEDKPNNRIFTQEVVDEIERVESFYRRGERAFTIAKACKKDEALPVAKDKVRIFYGNPIAFTFLVRKYYLPILRFLQMNPLVAECAVGINSQSPEWDEFYKHATHYGKDTLFGGDYGKYDQKLPSQLLFASLRILIDLAKECNYSDQDLSIMEAMTGDLVYAFIAFNGDLIGLQSGTHVSGNSLTVILNGICGSLNLRNFFYTQYDSSISFRSAVNIVTYGDDNIGSVSANFPKFNIRDCSKFLDTYGQVYTMPDKESSLTPYLQSDEFEFLKRANVYHPKLVCNVGALAEKSIFKSLHCYLRPKKSPLTPSEACAQNIDGALREWFLHGETIYEKRRSEMNEVATECGLKHMCFELDNTYEMCVQKWLDTYKQT